MIAPTSGPVSTASSQQATVCLSLITQAKKIVDLMHQLSEILSSDPKKIFCTPCSALGPLGKECVHLLKNNAKLAPNKELSDSMIRISTQVEECSRLFSEIIANSTEIVFLDCSMPISIAKAPKKMWYPFKPPF